MSPLPELSPEDPKPKPSLAGLDGADGGESRDTADIEKIGFGTTTGAKGPPADVCVAAEPEAPESDESESSKPSANPEESLEPKASVGVGGTAFELVTGVNGGCCNSGGIVSAVLEELSDSDEPVESTPLDWSVWDAPRMTVVTPSAPTMVVENPPPELDQGLDCPDSAELTGLD